MFVSIFNDDAEKKWLVGIKLQYWINDFFLLILIIRKETDIISDKARPSMKRMVHLFWWYQSSISLSFFLP